MSEEHGHAGLRQDLVMWLTSHMEDRRGEYDVALQEAERKAMETGQDAPEKPGDLQAEIDAMLAGGPAKPVVTVDPAKVEFTFGPGDLIVMENNPNSHDYPLGQAVLLWINGGSSPKGLFWNASNEPQLGNNPPLDSADGYKAAHKGAQVRLATEDEERTWVKAFLAHVVNMNRLDASPAAMLAVALDRAAELEAED